MYSKVLALLALTAVAHSHDFLEGANNTQAKKIYSEHHEASPAIWKQTKDLHINASDYGVISKINVTDLRPEKDGDVYIVSGGVEHDNVTITIKSPTILRGYDFLVEVYAVSEENERKNRDVVSEWQQGTQQGDVPAQFPQVRPHFPENPQKPAKLPEIPSQSHIPSPDQPVQFPEVPADKLTSKVPSFVTGKPTTEVSSTGHPSTGHAEHSTTEYPAKGHPTTEKLVEPSTTYSGPTIVFGTPNEQVTVKNYEPKTEKVTVSTTEAAVTLADFTTKWIQFPVEVQQAQESQYVKGVQPKRY